MGEVDIAFKSSVPVFDCNVSIGRVHTRRLSVDDSQGTLKAMDDAGINKALVHNPYGANYDPVDGNERLLESINGIDRFVPQFTCNPATFNIETFSKSVSDNNIKSLRMEPISQDYPFVEWIVGECMEWITKSNLTLFIPATDINPNEFHSILKSFPKSKVVLSDLHYGHVSWAIPLLKSINNLYVEISKFSIADSIVRLRQTVGDNRILYGSKFPYQPMGPQLYSLHRWGLDETTLADICSNNLNTILGQ